MKQAPKEITAAALDVVVMPNGEIICYGKTIGWVRELGRFLTPKPTAQDCTKS